MKNEDRRGREDGNLTEKMKMIQERSLINASAPVNEKKFSGAAVSQSSTCPMSFTKDKNTRKDENLTLSTTKQTFKSC